MLFPGSPCCCQILPSLGGQGIAFARRHLEQLFVVGVLLVMMAQNLDTLISNYRPRKVAYTAAIAHGSSSPEAGVS